MLDDATTEKKSRPHLKLKSNDIVYGAYTVHEITHTHNNTINTPIGCPNIYRVQDCIGCDRTGFLKSLDRILSKYV